MSDSNPEVIKAQMAVTRHSLAEKIETLEEKVVHSMQDATAVLHDTIDSARDVVHETVATVKDAMASTGDLVKSSVTSVKETFDLPLQVDRHPWVAVGTAVAAGFVVGSMMESGHATTNEARKSSSAKEPPTFSKAADFNSNEESQSTPRQSHGNVPAAIAKHLEPMKGFAIGAAMSVIRNVLAKGLHEEWSKPVFEAIDEITKELGGRPIKSGTAGNEAKS